jgi:hypothetical protein
MQDSEVIPWQDSWSVNILLQRIKNLNLAVAAGVVAGC